MKKRKNNFKFSNRILYSLITLGILAIFAVGVYAYGTSSPSTFGHSGAEINVDNTFCVRITGHNCGYDTDTDTNTWPPYGTVIYMISNQYCGNVGTLTTSSTCMTNSAYDSAGKHISCDGGYYRELQYCPNTYLGRLMNV